MRKFIVVNRNTCSQNIPLSGTGIYFRLEPGAKKEFDNLTPAQISSLRQLRPFKIHLMVERTVDTAVEAPVVTAPSDDYDTLSKAQCIERAKALGKVADMSMTKAQIIEVLRS